LSASVVRLRWSTGDGSLHPGLNAFVEYEPVENWLELELSVSVLAVEGGREVPVDLLFQKTISTHSSTRADDRRRPSDCVRFRQRKEGTFVGGQDALDFMFWPSRNVGLWVEPSYEFLFGSNFSHGLSTTGGVIFGW